MPAKVLNENVTDGLNLQARSPNVLEIARVFVHERCLCRFPRPILNCFGKVRRLNSIRVREIGNRARALKDAMKRARTHMQLLHRRAL